MEILGVDLKCKIVVKFPLFDLFLLPQKPFCALVYGLYKLLCKFREQHNMYFSMASNNNRVHMKLWIVCRAWSP